MLFTVSVDLRRLDGWDKVFIGSWTGLGDWPLQQSDFMHFIDFTGGDGPNVYKTITFPSTNMAIAYMDARTEFDIKWNILVQGTPGTTIHVL